MIFTESNTTAYIYTTSVSSADQDLTHEIPRTYTTTNNSISSTQSQPNLENGTQVVTSLIGQAKISRSNSIHINILNLQKNGAENISNPLNQISLLILIIIHFQ